MLGRGVGMGAGAGLAAMREAADRRGLGTGGFGRLVERWHSVLVAATIGVLQHAAPDAREPLALAAILGGNIGPTVTPFGSLATLIWLAIIRRRGERLSGRDYLRVGVVTAPPTLLAAVLALWLVLR